MNRSHFARKPVVISKADAVDFVALYTKHLVYLTAYEATKFLTAQIDAS